MRKKEREAREDEVKGELVRIMHKVQDAEDKAAAYRSENFITGWCTGVCRCIPGDVSIANSVVGINLQQYVHYGDEDYWKRAVNALRMIGVDTTQFGKEVVK